MSFLQNKPFFLRETVACPAPAQPRVAQQRETNDAERCARASPDRY